MMGSILTQQLEKIKDKLTYLAKETKFIKREVKLTPYNFLASLLTNNNKRLFSDELICNNLQEDYGVDIKRQSLNERLHTNESVEYLKRVFQELLYENNIYNTKEYKDISYINLMFNNIYVEDNSTISLHESMSDIFKGVGGKASNSAIKIYLNYIANKSQIADIQIHQGTISDTSLSNVIIDKLQKDDLVIRDLGFFKIESFESIIEKEAYFLSRYFLSTNIYINNKKVDILQFIQSKKEFTILDELIELSNNKLPIRLIVYKVSDEIYNKRVYNLKKAHNKRGKTPTKRALKLQKYLLFITNIDKEVISKEEIGTLYRLRWQIELVFKRWKSFMNISVITTNSKKRDNSANKKGQKVGNRILCFIYAKLIAILLMTTIETIAHLLAINKSRELSPDKFTKWIISRDRLQKLFMGEYSVEKLLKLLEQNIMRLLKDKRRKNLSTRKLINQKIGFYEELKMSGMLSCGCLA